MRTDIVSSNQCILEYGQHIGKVFTETCRNADVAFYHTKQSAVNHSCQNLVLCHIQFLVGWNFRFLLPLTLPHLDYFNGTSKIGCIFLCVIQQLCHRFTVQRIRLLRIVAISTTMKEATMKLISRTRFRAPTVDQELAYTLFSTNGLVSNIAAGFKRYRRQPLRSHLSVCLRSLRTEPLLFTTTRIPYTRPTDTARWRHSPQWIDTSLHRVSS